jgi:hypothetical protein
MGILEEKMVPFQRLGRGTLGAWVAEKIHDDCVPEESQWVRRILGVEEDMWKKPNRCVEYPCGKSGWSEHKVMKR